MNSKNTATAANCHCSSSNASLASADGVCACKDPCGVPEFAVGMFGTIYWLTEEAERSGAEGPMHAGEDMTPLPGVSETVQPMDNSNACHDDRNPQLPFMAGWKPGVIMARKGLPSEDSAGSCRKLSGIAESGGKPEQAGDAGKLTGGYRQMELPFMAGWVPKSKREAQS